MAWKWTVINDDVIVFPMAGGEAAYSALLLMEFKKGANILAVDDSPTALTFWTDIGATTIDFEEMWETVDHPHFRDRLYFAPCFEKYLDTLQGYCLYGHPDNPNVDSKRGTLEFVAKECHLVKTPTLYPKMVSRKEGTSGCSGLQVLGGEEYCVTEYIAPDYEVVVDFNTSTSMYLPRITHHLRRGADTYCTMLGELSKGYETLRNITLEVCGALGIEGVGNLQLIYSKGSYYFVEISLRVSGAAWLNLLTGNNHLLGHTSSPFDTMETHTNGAAAMYLRGTHGNSAGPNPRR
jgi:hypothetical protein